MEYSFICIKEKEKEKERLECQRTGGEKGRTKERERMRHEKKNILASYAEYEKIDQSIFLVIF